MEKCGERSLQNVDMKGNVKLNNGARKEGLKKIGERHGKLNIITKIRTLITPRVYIEICF